LLSKAYNPEWIQLNSDWTMALQVKDYFISTITWLFAFFCIVLALLSNPLGSLEKIIVVGVVVFVLLYVRNWLLGKHNLYKSLLAFSYSENPPKFNMVSGEKIIHYLPLAIISGSWWQTLDYPTINKVVFTNKRIVIISTLFKWSWIYSLVLSFDKQKDLSDVTTITTNKSISKIFVENRVHFGKCLSVLDQKGNPVHIYCFDAEKILQKISPFIK